MKNNWFFRGECDESGAWLPRSDLTDEEFSRLKDAVREKLLISKDVYLSSNPKEIKT